MKTRILLVTLLIMFVMTADAQINEFHGTELVCRTCHTIHYSQNGESPPNTGFGPDGTSGADVTGPYPQLLVKASSTDLCLMCHQDGGGGDGETPDVVGIDSNGLGDARAAGFFPEPAPDPGDPGGPILGPVGVITPNGHNLGENGEDPWGYNSCSRCHPEYWGSSAGPVNEFEMGCVTCHDPHGRNIDHTYTSNYRYRNLWWIGPDYTEPIIKGFMNPTTVGSIDRYRQENITYGVPSVLPDPPWIEVTTVCTGCHHGYNTQTRVADDADGIPYRHPSTTTEHKGDGGRYEPINSGQTEPAHWVGGTGIGFDGGVSRLPFLVLDASDFASGGIVAEDNHVFCLTCHKPHGTQHSDALRWDNDGPNKGCQQCHDTGN